MLGDISALDNVYIVCGRTDMRKQIDGLCAIIEEQLKMNLSILWQKKRPHKSNIS